MRCRITLTLLPVQTEYHDEITNVKLLAYINDFLKRVKLVDKLDVTFVSSYEYDAYDNTYERLGTRFKQTIGGMEFSYGIDGFAQVTKRAADFAHDTVLTMLSSCKDRDNFIGIGGESLLYGIAGKFDKITAYTNSPGIHRDNLENCSSGSFECHLVDYDEFKLSVDIPTVCVANVSRNGIRQTLCNQLNQLYIRDIIAVYCADVHERDLAYLANYYVHKSEDNDNIRVVWFKRVPLVSLGNNCAIAYQLTKLNLRDARYPFDWLRYKRANQLIECLSDRFQNFTNVVSSKKPAGKFKLLRDDVLGDNDSDEILINTYKMEFPHDAREEMFRYNNRILRMFDLPFVDYVIDCIVDEVQIEKIKSLLPNLRRLIIVKNINPLVHSPDTWKKDHLNWIDTLS